MNKVCFVRRSRRGRCLKSQIDTFVNSDIFRDEFGMEVSDINVYANVQSNPELANRVREMLIVQDVKGFDSSVPDDEVISALEQKYSSASQALNAVKLRISEIRTEELAEKRYKEYLEQFKKEGNNEP